MALAILLVLSLSLPLTCETFPSYDVKLSSVFFNGGFILFPVKRAKVQERLNEINCQFGNDDIKVVLPSNPVLQDLINIDEHVVMIGFGTDESVAFENVMTDDEERTESPFMTGLGISIPYLSTSASDSQNITVQMKLFTSGAGHHIDANVGLSAQIVADRFTYENNTTGVDIQVEKDDFELHIVGEKRATCSPNGHEDEEVKEYEREYQISRSGPDFSICDRLPDLQVDLCEVYRNPVYNQVLKEARNNVCQYWERTNDVKSTKVSFHVVSMSDRMREYLLLEEDQGVLEGELQSGTFDVNLVFPCIE